MNIRLMAQMLVMPALVAALIAFYLIVNIAAGSSRSEEFRSGNDGYGNYGYSDVSEDYGYAEGLDEPDW